MNKKLLSFILHPSAFILKFHALSAVAEASLT